MNHTEQLVLTSKQCLTSLGDDDQIGSLNPTKLSGVVTKIDTALSPAKMQVGPKHSNEASTRNYDYERCGDLHSCIS